jgi:hypothetical protein
MIVGERLKVVVIRAFRRARYGDDLFAVLLPEGYCNRRIVCDALRDGRVIIR